MGAATTPSVRRATEVLMAPSMASILDENFPILPAAKSEPMARAASSRLNPWASSSRTLSATPSIPISFSTLSAKSTAVGTSTERLGSFP